MENAVWTIFHRSGKYTTGYEPLWQRYLCYGGQAEEKSISADSTGNRENCLKLYLPTYGVRLIDGAGQTVTLEEAAIGPGDLLKMGEVSEPGRGCYRIGAVTVQTGSGLVSGHTLVAE